MEAANAQMAAALTVSESAGHDYDFHFCLVEATGNEVLIRMYRVLATALRDAMKKDLDQAKATAAAAEQASKAQQAELDAAIGGTETAK